MHHDTAVFKQLAHPETQGADFVMSDATVDRYGDVVEPGGWDLGNFQRHPIALFNHDIDQPIGLWKDVRVERGGLRGRLVLAEGAAPEIDKLAKLVEMGVLKAVSVGFKPLEREPIREGKGVRFKRQELLECSLVTVPANPNALQVAKSLGLSDAMVARVFGVNAATAPDTATRGSTGVHAATSRNSGGAVMEPIARKIEIAQQKIDELQAQLDEHEAAIGDEPDEAALNTREEINNKAGLARRNLASLQDIERNMGSRAVQAAAEKKIAAVSGEVLPPLRAFATAEKKLEPKDRAMQVLVGLVVAHQKKRPVLEVIAERYGSDGRVDPITRGMVDVVARREGRDAIEVVQRAATAPATTTTTGWASQLVQTTNMGFLELLMPQSVFPGLRARAGLALDFGRAGVISIPTRAATPTIAGSFVAEGAPIPVRQAAFGSQTFTPKKMAVITSFTREIAEHSNPTIEGLLRNAIQEDTSVSLDTVLLDATVASAIRPAGIRAGVSVTTAVDRRWLQRPRRRHQGAARRPDHRLGGQPAAPVLAHEPDPGHLDRAYAECRRRLPVQAGGQRRNAAGLADHREFDDHGRHGDCRRCRGLRGHRRGRASVRPQRSDGARLRRHGPGSDRCDRLAERRRRPG
jgi:HK97 family phage prohead protease